MTWLWALVAVYVLVTLLMFLAQRSLIYPAAAIAPQIADQGLAELRAIVTEPEPGLRITHWYHPPAGEREPLVVFFHGNGSDLGNAFLKMRPFVEAGRSEEHTSELQSLMRISYAVFCLKKKKNK